MVLFFNRQFSKARNLCKRLSNWFHWFLLLVRSHLWFVFPNGLTRTDKATRNTFTHTHTLQTDLPVRCSSGPPWPPCSSVAASSPLGTPGIFLFSYHIKQRENIEAYNTSVPTSDISGDLTATDYISFSFFGSKRVLSGCVLFQVNFVPTFEKEQWSFFNDIQYNNN